MKLDIIGDRRRPKILLTIRPSQTAVALRHFFRISKIIV